MYIGCLLIASLLSCCLRRSILFYKLRRSLISIVLRLRTFISENTPTWPNWSRSSFSQAAAMVLIPQRNSLGIAIISIGAVAGLLAIIAVLLRVWARRIKAVALDASDWTCILGLVRLVSWIKSSWYRWHCPGHGACFRRSNSEQYVLSWYYGRKDPKLILLQLLFRV